MIFVEADLADGFDAVDAVDAVDAAGHTGLVTVLAERVEGSGSTTDLRTRRIIGIATELTEPPVDPADGPEGRTTGQHAERRTRVRVRVGTVGWRTGPRPSRCPSRSA